MDEVYGVEWEQGLAPMVAGRSFGILNPEVYYIRRWTFSAATREERGAFNRY